MEWKNIIIAANNSRKNLELFFYPKEKRLLIFKGSPFNYFLVSGVTAT